MITGYFSDLMSTWLDGFGYWTESLKIICKSFGYNKNYHELSFGVELRVLDKFGSGAKVLNDKLSAETSFVY